MAEIPTPDQVGGATVWFTSEAGIVATVLAFVSISLAIALVWTVRAWRNSQAESEKAWAKTIESLTQAWGARMDQFRADVKEAFAQNDDIAEKVATALENVKLEVARMSGLHERR